MNAKISVLAIRVEAIIHLLYNFHYCTFKSKVDIFRKGLPAPPF